MDRVYQSGRIGALAAILSLGLVGCAAEVAKEQLSAGILPPVVNPVTETNRTLRILPPPSQKVAVAVYNYTDQTGQFKPSETTQTLSKAVTQGATSILIKALQDVGEGSWFTVVERERIDNLMKERQIIMQMRMIYLKEKSINPQALPPLLFAAIIFEGGIIGYDSNIQTGGVGARLLGIGGDIKYRLDTITIYLRAVSTKTGQVLASVTTHKTIASIGLQGGIFKFIAIDKILEAEAGFTKNEPDQLAVQQAIEKAVYSMIIEGAANNIWSFSDRKAQEKLIDSFREGNGPVLAQAKAVGPTITSAAVAREEATKNSLSKFASTLETVTQVDSRSTPTVPIKSPAKQDAASGMGAAEKAADVSWQASFVETKTGMHGQANLRSWVADVVTMEDQYTHSTTAY